jgi:TatD DNase family protein
MQLHDAHNHLQDEWLAPHLETIALDCARAGITAMVVNGTAEHDWPRVAALAARFPWVHASYGLHPWDVRSRTPGWHETLRSFLLGDEQAGVGEIGIDRWILEDARPGDAPVNPGDAASLQEQLEVFRAQLALAVELDRPVTIHCLRAWGALRDELGGTIRPRRGFLLHAYGGPAEMVPEWVELGAWFSFNTAFLDPRKTRQRAAFRVVPADRLLIESDAPAMPPPGAQCRYPLPAAPEGRPVNHPANVVAAYAGLAELRGMPVERLAAQLADNFARWLSARA